MSQDAVAKLDTYIASLRKKLTIAEHTRQNLVENPELADVLLQELPGAAAQPVNGKQPKAKKKPDGPTHKGGPVAAEYFRKIATFLKTSGGRKTSNEIIEQTGLKRNAVVQVLYRTHKGYFEREAAPDNALRKVWSLKPGVSIEEVVKG